MNAVGSRRRPGGVFWRRSWLIFGCAWVAAAQAGDAPPVMVQSGPGRFEIAARDSAVAHALAVLADETWRALEGPLALPPGFSTPIYTRVGEGAEADGFRSAVEPGGVVTVRLAGSAARPGRNERRALVHGLLLRQAVTWHGAAPSVTAASWLVEAAVRWCETRRDPASIDAAKYAAAQHGAPTLAEIWAQGGAAGAEAERRGWGAFWLMSFLQTETTRMGEWPALVRALAAGEAEETALPEAFPGRFGTPADRELWWMTGWHHLRRIRSLPLLESAESRDEVAARVRFVFAQEEDDIVVPLRTVLAHAGEAIVAVELKRRGAELARLAPSLHPFYRNAALSLVAVFEAAGAKPALRDAALAQFEADWRDGDELAAATRAALDAEERRQRAPK